MPNKTLSVRNDDAPLWERAERAARAARTTVSALVATALAEKLGMTDTCQVLVYDSGYGANRRIEAFTGRWLTTAPNLKSSNDLDANTLWKLYGYRTEWSTHIAETARGRIAVYAHHYNFGAFTPPLFEVFEDISSAQQELKDDPRVAQHLLTDAGLELGRSGKRGEEIRWRDI